MELHNDQEAGVRRQEATAAEDTPLLRPMSTKSAAGLCTCGVISVLVLCWSILHFWNRQLSSQLFNIGDIRMLDMTRSHELVHVTAPFQKFIYPLTLAFLQFVFMGIVFLVMYVAATQQRPSELVIPNFTTDRRWPALVVSHVFSTFWLQSLMMPSQVMSLGLFAASRAFEIPAVAFSRPPLLGHRFGIKSLQTTSFAFGSACLLYFAYAQLAGCVCILSGNGVALSGLAFWIVYALVLGMPGVNAACQEAIMIQPGTHPLFVLAVQNIFASLLFMPVLVVSHLVGWEDIAGAFRMILSHQEVFMIVMWICAQIALTSVVCIVLIQVVDAFWAVALRPVRVVLWGIIALLNFCLTSGLALSIACPRSSFWSFVILTGCGLAAAAIYTDRKDGDGFSVAKDAGIPHSSGTEKAINKPSV